MKTTTQPPAVPAPVKVLFRKWPTGDICALMPRDAGTNNPGTCMSYAHIGQHGSADAFEVIRSSRPASAAEYRPLAAELRRIGYALDIRQRASRADYNERKRQIAAII